MMYTLLKDSQARRDAAAGGHKRSVQERSQSFMHWQAEYDRLPDADEDKAFCIQKFKDKKQAVQLGAPYHRSDDFVADVITRLSASTGDAYAPMPQSCLGLGCARYPLAPANIEQLHTKLGTASLRATCPA